MRFKGSKRNENNLINWWVNTVRFVVNKMTDKFYILASINDRIELLQLNQQISDHSLVCFLASNFKIITISTLLKQKKNQKLNQYRRGGGLDLSRLPQTIGSY